MDLFYNAPESTCSQTQTKAAASVQHEVMTLQQDCRRRHWLLNVIMTMRRTLPSSDELAASGEQTTGRLITVTRWDTPKHTTVHYTILADKRRLYLYISRVVLSPWNSASRLLCLHLPLEATVWCLDTSRLCRSWSVALHVHKVPTWWASTCAGLHDTDLVPFKAIQQCPQVAWQVKARWTIVSHRSRRPVFFPLCVD